MAKSAREAEERGGGVAPVSVAELLSKSPDKTLRRVGEVYSYPGAPLDPAATNLRLPLEYVTLDAVVLALANEEIRALAVDPLSGRPLTVVEASEENAEVVAVSSLHAGTAYAGTEPTGGRPEHDAGVKPPETKPEDGEGLDKPPPGTDPPLGGSRSSRRAASSSDE